MVFFWLIISGSSQAESPILGYEKEQRHQKKYFYTMPLQHARTFEMLPILRSLCRECDWVIQHSQQQIGVYCNEKQWRMYRAAIRSMDKKDAMVGLSLDVIEFSNIQSERYQQLFSQLTSPIQIDDTIDGMIQMMVSSGNAKMVSSPRLIGRSGKKMTLNVGDRIPYQTVVQHSNGIQRNIQYIQSGIQVSIVPYVHKNQTIDLEIELTYNAVTGYRNEAGAEMPIVASRTSKVDIQVTKNQTIIFSGLLDQSQHESVEKVPIIGDVPFFRRTLSKK